MPEQRPSPDTRTLEEALRETAIAKWQGRRCYATNMSQATIAVFAVKRAEADNKGWRDHLSDRSAKALAALTVGDISPTAIKSCTSRWYSEGLAPATINKRLNCLSAMGVSVEGCRVREPKVLKWWLKPEDEATLTLALFDRWRGGCPKANHMARFIAWTTRTGLRVEETLRLRKGDFHRDSVESYAVTVPGLKTAEAQATLPLGAEAAEMVVARFIQLDPDDRFIPLTYPELEAEWRWCRALLNAADNPTATLKALRRSAARHLHVAKGMPLDMVRQYLRHEDIETTMGYLRLTGGYGTEEMRKWL